MKTLDQLGILTNSDKSSKYHNYLNFYENFFSKLRNLNNNILEIGILNGDSLSLMSNYFQNSTIYGIDIEDKSYLNIPRCKTFQGDQSNRNFLSSFGNLQYDIILDDGSHKMNHQQISFGVLFKYLKPGGIYIIEDLHTSDPNYIETRNYGLGLFDLWPNFENSTINFLQKLKTTDYTNNYLTKEEFDYLTCNVEDLIIKSTSSKNNFEFSITSVITKKL